MMKIPGKLGAKALTEALRRLSFEATTITDDGTPLSRAEQLADLVWKYALGWTESTTTPEGRKVEIKHPPVAWAMQYMFERLEGKAPIAVQDENPGIKAADKVRQLAVDRVNSMAKVGGPPKFKPKGDA